MTHSTTATATHALSRYSRSYPSVAQHPKQIAESEWQHFVNPIIRLVLDVKKSSSGELESFRLRVVWSIGSGKDVMVDQTEVVFVSRTPFVGTLAINRYARLGRFRAAILLIFIYTSTSTGFSSSGSPT
jgi:hypothetical protein